MILTEETIDGVKRKVLLHADRNGFFYTLDRTDGSFLSATAYVKQTWNKGFDAKGRPIFAPNWKSSREGVIVAPSLVGGANWQNPSYDAEPLDLFFDCISRQDRSTAARRCSTRRAVSTLAAPPEAVVNRA